MYPHLRLTQELNARTDMPVEVVIVRSGQEAIVVNLDIPSPEPGSGAPDSDPFHSTPTKIVSTNVILLGYKLQQLQMVKAAETYRLVLEHIAIAQGSKGSHDVLYFIEGGDHDDFYSRGR